MCDALVTLQDGKYTETLSGVVTTDGECLFSGAFDRSGTYVVTVTASGFQPASRTVVVRQGGCGTAVQIVEIMLEEVPASNGGISR